MVSTGEEFFYSRTPREVVGDALILMPESLELAYGLRHQARFLAQKAICHGLRQVKIFFPNCGENPWVVPACLAIEEELSAQDSPTQDSGLRTQDSDLAQEIDRAPNELLSVPEQELTPAFFKDSDRPTYINRISDQENLWCNSAAQQAQSNKPKFLGQNAYSLNDPDELEYRCDRLLQGEALREYEYKAWRWYFDEDSKLWRLKRMQFYSNFRRLPNGINLGAQLNTSDECWLGQVLVAEEVP